MNTKPRAVTDREGRPVRLLVTVGQVSDSRGSLALQSQSPQADWLIADRGYDADRFRNALSDSKIRACVPPRKSCTAPVKYGKRHRIPIMFGRIKDRRRAATRHDRCPKVVLLAIVFAATVIYRP